MRLLIVSHYFEEHGGGIEIVAGKLARLLAQRGIQIRWLAAEEPGLKAVTAIERKSLKNWDPLGPRGIPYPLFRPSALIQVWNETKRCDVLHLHDTLYWDCISAFCSAKLHGIPVVVTQHVGFIPYSSRLLRGLLTFLHRTVSRSILGGADRVIFLNERIRFYYSRFSAFRKPPLIIANGVDRKQFFPPEKESRRQLRRRLLRADRLTVLFVGRFVEKKGMRLLQALAPRFPNWEWVFIGWGPLDPSGWRLDNVRSLGRLPQSETVPWYQAADLLILPSVGEGFPLVIQEAMACGTPVVTSQETVESHPGLQDVAYSALPDVASLTEVLKGIEKSAADLEPMRAKAYEFARKHWDWETCADRYLETLLGANQLPAAKRKTARNVS